MFLKIRSNAYGLDFANSMGINDLINNSNANSTWDTESFIYTDGTTQNALYLALNRTDVNIGSSYSYLLSGVSSSTNSAKIVWRHYYMKDGTTKDQMTATGYTGNRASPLNVGSTVTIVSDTISLSDVKYAEEITAIIPGVTGVMNIRCSSSFYIKIYQWSDSGGYYLGIRKETGLSMSTSNAFMQVNLVPSAGEFLLLHNKDASIEGEIAEIGEAITDINGDIERIDNSIGTYSNEFITR